MRRKGSAKLKRMRRPSGRENARVLIASGLSDAARRGVVRLGVLNLACAFGKLGRNVRKREGDGVTPAGRWRLVRVLYRADRIRRPVTGLPVKAIGPCDGWCDAPADPNYNRPVRLPYAASAETLWRPDGLYDVAVVLNHNSRPRVRGAGSAIFMHVARPGYLPTEGCIALQREHLLALLRRVGTGAAIRVLP